MRELIEVAPGVHVTVSRRMHTTSTVLAGSGCAFLVDPAWLPDELDHLADLISEHAWRVTGGFATHAHHDHLLWHPRFGDAPRWASRATAELARSERAALVSFLGDDFPERLVELMGRVDPVDGQLPESALPHGFVSELIVHDGHAPGHTAIWLADQHVLIAGDMLSDIELPLPFWPDDLPAYIAALDHLAPFAAAARSIIPGHGTIGDDALARLDADRRYIDDVVRRMTSESATPACARRTHTCRRSAVADLPRQS